MNSSINFKDEKKDQVDVSIIIPTYNAEKYISRALDSAIQQTYAEIEIIVVDDGSTDNTYKVIQAYQKKDLRIQYYKKINGGVSSARNIGLKVARGEYVIFLDSDDWLEKDAVLYLLDIARKSGGRLVACDRYFVVENSKLIQRPNICQEARVQKVDRIEALVSIGKEGYNLQSACYKLFQRQIIDRYNIRFQEDIYYGEDGLFTFSYLCHVDGVIYSTEKKWNILRREDSSTTAGYNSKWISSITAIERMKDIAEESMEVNEVLMGSISENLNRHVRRVMHAYLESDKKLPEDFDKLQKMLRLQRRSFEKYEANIRERIKYYLYMFLNEKILRKILWCKYK